MSLQKKGREMLARLGADEKKGIIVGFSGGADSVALLHFLAEKCAFRENVTAFHVNHMLRGSDSESDEAFCRDFCLAHGIAFECARINIAEISGGSAVEETARIERYAALCGCAAKKGARYIALAHTETDNAETLIFNIVRGSGIKGACGIPPSRPCGDFVIIRPLISCTREETEKYCRENGLDFVTDKTNFDTHYTRNFIRHEILPLLRRINPAAEDSIGNFCALASRDSDFIEKEADGFFAALANKNTAGIAALLSLHEAVRTRVIARMYEAAGGERAQSCHVNAVCGLLCGNTGDKTELPHGIFAVVTGDELTFMKKEDFAALSCEKCEETELFMGENRFGDSVICLSPCADRAIEEKYACEYGLCYVKPFVAEKNEKITAKTALSRDSYRAGGITRSIKKLRTSLSLYARKSRPVICFSGAPAWYPGFDISDDRKGNNPALYIYYFERT